MIPNTPAGRHERLAPKYDRSMPDQSGPDREADLLRPLAHRRDLDPAETRAMRWALGIGLACVVVLMLGISVGMLVAPVSLDAFAFAGP